MVTVTKAFSHTKETAYLVVICKSGRFSFSVFEELHLMSREFIIVCTFNPLLFAVSWKEICLFLISWTSIKVEKIWISKFYYLAYMKMANPWTELRLATSLWRKANTHRITSINIEWEKCNIINTKHETWDKQIREKWKLTLSWQ